MERPEIPSMTDFRSGEDDYGDQWFAGTFSQDGIEMKANNFQGGYSTRWGTYKDLEGVIHDINEFYRLRSSVDLMEMSDDNVTSRHYNLNKGDASITDFDLEDVIHAELKSDDFRAVWAQNEPKLMKADYIPTNSLIITVDEPVEYSSEPFLEPTWLLLQESAGREEEAVSQITYDAGRFLNRTEDLL